MGDLIPKGAKGSFNNVLQNNSPYQGKLWQDMRCQGPSKPRRLMCSPPKGIKTKLLPRAQRQTPLIHSYPANLLIAAIVPFGLATTSATYADTTIQISILLLGPARSYIQSCPSYNSQRSSGPGRFSLFHWGPCFQKHNLQGTRSKVCILPPCIIQLTLENIKNTNGPKFSWRGPSKITESNCLTTSRLTKS